MTFNQVVKSEVLKNMNKLPQCCKTAALSAFIKCSASLGTDSSGFTATLKGSFLPIVPTLIQPQWQVVFSESNKGLRISNARKMLCDCGILGFNNGLELVEGVYEPFTEKECCSKTYLTALYIGCGSVSIPMQESVNDESKRGYHFELVLPSVETALDVVNMFGEFNFDARLGCRGDKQLVYFKDSEDISDLLAFFGASQGVFTLQNSKAVRSVRAEVNRTSNCISANIARAAESGVRQAECVKKLEVAGELERLPKDLKETALLRKMYPEATLAEMVELHKGSIGKSGVNHRLKAIEKLAEELK